MKRSSFVVVGMLALIGAVALAVPALSSGSADGPKVVSGAVLTPVTGPYVGSSVIRGVSGGGLPWRLASGNVDLRADGRLHVEVEGLVFAAGPNEGRNTVPAFGATVSCQTIVNGAATVSNIPTATFPASAAGNATIDTTMSLPSPCIAPIVFVTSPGGAWFAATGV